MILLQSLKIDANKSIDIVMSPVEDKFNLYYKPTSELHRFDEIFFILKEKDKEIIIVSESAEYIIDTTKQTLEFALKNKLILLKMIDVGHLGRHYNIDTYSEDDDDINYTQFSLYSGGLTRTNLHTFMYNKDKKIYLEVAPVYSWIWDDPTTVTDESYIAFDEFMKTYKPIVVEELDYATVQKWIEQCNEVLRIMVMGIM